MNNKYKILIVEDESNIRSFVKTILETNGYQVLDSRTGTQAKMMFSSHCPDLIILDLGLPDFDGTEFIKEVRKSHSVPIIVLSARTQEEDKVQALDLGANDYVTKPFGTAELLARVRAALRNSRHGIDGEKEGNKPFVLRYLKIDYESRTVTMKHMSVKLTQTEFNIVALLSEHAGKVMTYSVIIQTIWGSSDTGSIKKLQVNMANIRKKLGIKPGSNQYISNELGVGYRMYNE